MSMSGVINLRTRFLGGGLDLRVLVCRKVFPSRHKLGQRRRSRLTSRSLQETGEIKTAVPPRLQMPLLDPGYLSAKPGIGLACGSNDQIDRHMAPWATADGAASDK